MQKINNIKNYLNECKKHKEILSVSTVLKQKFPLNIKTLI